ncbi:glycosyltransferase family 4 protein [Micromonospora sp. NPDC018662]|uniref:glycosyltransferase family 4 protein n=1 Tax=Micromonospora sp. NPDC018662 TaxID=3364238 RepID=UPI0037912EDB
MHTSEATPPPPARPLSVLQVVPPWLPVPPTGYGGIEAVCATLVEELVARGHHVELVAGGGSHVPAPLHTAFPKPMPDRINDNIVDLVHAATVQEIVAAGNFDVIHDHTWLGALLAPLRSVPALTTIHNHPSREWLTFTEMVSATSPLIGVSQAHVDSLPTVTWSGYVHNGIPTARYPFTPDRPREEWVLYLGRATRVKGMHTAIDVARQAGRRIVLAAKWNEPSEKKYYAEYIEPRLGDDTEWLGEVDFDTKVELLSKATCLLNPIDWHEPFGLVMAEAQACGTPVVALRRGAAPEVVEHGRTGYVFETVPELAAGIDRAAQLSPYDCRERAVRLFDSAVMAAGYEAQYEKLIGRA